MILDSQEVFSAAQAFTATGDTVSTNQLDTLSNSDEGIGEDVSLYAKVNTTFTSGGATTMQVVLQSSADNATYVDKYVSPVYALAALTAGAVLVNAVIPIGPSTTANRYLRVVYRVAVAVFTGGSMDAFIVKNPQAYQFGANGFAVL